MKNYTIKRYEPSDYDAWNAFVSSAKNATFLFHRDFMEYHSSRFSDFSLMVFDNQKLLAVLPANISGDTLFSHQGLTYGGFVFPANLRLETVLGIVRATLAYLAANRIKILHLKLLPHIYVDYFSDEIQYILFIAKAKLLRRDCLSVIDMSKPLRIAPGRSEGIKKGLRHNLIVREENGFSDFWNMILIPNLNEKHGAKPVHTIDEISFLKSRFPANIRQFNVYHDGKIVAGTTIFETSNVAHAQYISGNNDKNELGSVDFLYDHLLRLVYHEKKFFDFGMSNENAGKNVNEGLLFWKESFGSKIITQDFYQLETANFAKLSTVML